MKLKNKLRNFFTLNPRASEGFTLVELIVVIAILAILGGASVPAYNLYIKKARESADSQVLAAVNTAFASACLENKLEVADVQSASVKVENGVVQGLVSVSPSTDADGIKNAFLRYMEGNGNTKFKTEPVNTLQWKAEKGSFEILTLALKYGNAILNADALAAILGSNFDDMGAGQILQLLADNVGTFEKIINAIYDPLGQATLNGLGKLLGKDLSGMNSSALERSLMDGRALDGVISDEKRAEILAGLQSNDKKVRSAAVTEYSNAMVLLTAEKMTAPGVTAAGLTQKLKDSNGRPSDALGSILGSEGMANTMANTAVTQAMKTSFEETQSYKDAKDSYKNSFLPFEKSDAYKNAFDAYLIGEEGTKDMEALVGSMQLINDNKDIMGEDELLSQGINNESAQQILNTAMTPKTN